MDKVYQHINALSKVIYDKWGNSVSFDFASFARGGVSKMDREMPLRITWTLGAPVIQTALGGGIYVPPRYQFECERKLESEESNLYAYLTNVNDFVRILTQQEFSITAISALDTATPDRVSVIIECHRK